MKLQSVLIIVVASMVSSRSGHASGCGAPEIYPTEHVEMISRHRFNAKVVSYDIHFTTSLHSKPELQLHLHTELKSGKNEENQFWHHLELYGEVPKKVDFKKLDLALNRKNTKIEVVRDFFEINCANQSEGSETNLRIRVNYEGTVLEFRTRYVPDVNPLLN